MSQDGEMTKKKFLDSAYELDSAEKTRDFYKEWAQTYDQEITDNGYASPVRTAQALVSCGAQLDRPLLDIGCGTGISGVFLKQSGFKELHGSDFSTDMLALAKGKDLYSRLHHADLNNPFDFVEEQYQTVTAIGVMAPGHAGPQLIESVLTLTATGGLFGFSMNDHTLDDPGYLSEIDRLVKSRKMRIRWSEYGDHLPQIGLNSIIMVIEKLG